MLQRGCLLCLFFSLAVVGQNVKRAEGKHLVFWYVAITFNKKKLSASGCLTDKSKSVKMGRIKLCISLLCLLFLTNCTNLDDVNDRLDKVETKTSKKLPTGISVLRDKLLIAEGGTSCLEFRINPSDASFNYDVNSDSCEIELDCLGLTRSASSYVTPPSNYKLTKIEQAYDEKGALKKGQYRAYITDLGVSKDYSEMIALVLTTENSDKEKIQISSSAVRIEYAEELAVFTNFKFKASDNQGRVVEDIDAVIEGSDVVVTTPFILTANNLVADFETDGVKVYVDGKEQTSGESANDFSSPVRYTILSAYNETRNYTVTINHSALPIVYIKTPNAAPITSKTTWVENASITILKTDGSIDYTNEKLQIRGRGNSTWGYPKKPYALKLDSKAAILGMPKHKRWVLLANWMDRTLMRNDVAFQISKQTGLAWTPRGKFVEVVLNGKHMGNYYLCEQIKVNENRVNIAEMKETDLDGDAVTGGYLMELDVYYDEVNKFKSAIRRLPYMFKEPDEDVLQPAQLNYFRNYIDKMESVMYSDNWLDTREYANYMDLESFVDWWFVYELTMNGEPNHPKSSYMHKDRLGKLTAGPVWDFDWNTFTPGTSNIYRIKSAIYYDRLFDDPQFVTLVKSRWSVLKPKFETIPDYIKKTAAEIEVSNNINIKMWPISSTVNGDEKMTYEESIERMVSAYTEKLKWMDSQISNM